MKHNISPIEDIIEDVRAGRLVILVDDEERENEGDLIIAAEKVTPEAVNFMATHGRGLICMPMEPAIVTRLGLKPMTEDNTSTFSTAFTVSIGAKEGMTTGISAYDRALTVQVATRPDSGPEHITVPGHIFPLQAKAGGVLERDGHTEAATDLARLAGFQGAAVICEVMKDDGNMARLPELLVYAQKHGLKVGTIAALIKHRNQQKSFQEVAE